VAPAGSGCSGRTASAGLTIRQIKGRIAKDEDLTERINHMLLDLTPSPDPLTPSPDPSPLAFGGKRAGGVVVDRVRSASGQVFPTRYLRPPPLGSPRITAAHRYYGGLRLPATVALVLAGYTCSRVRESLCTSCRISPVNATSHCKARLGL
jgi:hypothetical protein